MKESRALKILSYIILPIALGIIIIAILYGNFSEVYEDKVDSQYFKSDKFVSRYMSGVNLNIKSLIYNQNDASVYGDMRIYYQDNNAYWEDKIKDNYYVIIYKPTNKVLTNVGYPANSSVEEMKKYIQNIEGKKVKIIDGELESDSDILRNKWIDYKNSFKGEYYVQVQNGSLSYIEKSAKEQYMLDEMSKRLNEALDNINSKLKTAEPIEEESTESEVTINSLVEYSINDFDIYMTYKEEFELDDSNELIVMFLKIIRTYENALFITVPICGLIVMLCGIYLIISIGYKKGNKNVELNDIDKIPLEIILAVVFIALFVAVAFIVEVPMTKKVYISGIVTFYFVAYVLLAVVVTTIIKRIKAKVFMKSTLCYRLYKIIEKCCEKVKTVFETLTEQMSETLKLGLFGISYIVIMINFLIFFATEDNIELGIFIDIILTLALFYAVVKRINGFKRIEEQLKKIYEGDTEGRLSKEDFSKEFGKTIDYINDISNGFERAVEEGVKSERLKTELITNVSHDIKTPLTSIINYVDLIKRENIENEKVKEYVEILENKSHRLKRLTEDLVEASKASSGNVKLNLEKLNLGELINQTTGEFEDRFKARNLNVIVNLPKEDIFINADSRYMYRVIENLFGNISKYALESSRVYIDINKNYGTAKVEIKNISDSKLNISADELMQRFVRGDKSRTTEGSGLGLSISKSLTELQGGKFNIYIDGDLFKVNLEFECM